MVAGQADSISDTAIGNPGGGVGWVLGTKGSETCKLLLHYLPSDALGIYIGMDRSRSEALPCCSYMITVQYK